MMINNIIDSNKLNDVDKNRLYNILSVLDSEFDSCIYVHNMTDELKDVLNNNGFDVYFEKNIGYRVNQNIK